VPGERIGSFFCDPSLQTTTGPEERITEQDQLHPQANKVCAVIVTYHIGTRIFPCIDSVMGQVGGIIIVDNNSDSETVNALHQLEARQQVEVIYNRINRGIASALNQAIRSAIKQRYRWVLTLDHDSEATPGMVEKLLQAYEVLGEGVGIVAANPFDRDSGMFLQRRQLELNKGRIIDVRTPISAGCLINARIFESAGFFNESLFVYYVDDDFSVRVRRNGLRIVLCRDAILRHSEGAKERRRFLWRQVFYERYGAEARYYIARNAVYMLQNRHDDYGYCYAVVRRLLSDPAKVLIYGPERLRKLKFMVRGLWDGVRGNYGPLRSAH
jgi:rhamnosyltransferase